MYKQTHIYTQTHTYTYTYGFYWDPVIVLHLKSVVIEGCKVNGESGLSKSRNVKRISFYLMSVGSGDHVILRTVVHFLRLVRSI